MYNPTKASWDKETLSKFDAMIQKMPVFHRLIAEKLVSEKAETNAKERASKDVQDADVIAAFFSQVPKPFYGLMIKGLEECKFDYKKYGFPKI